MPKLLHLVIWLLLTLLWPPALQASEANQEKSGEQLIREASRHLDQFPYVFEKQTMIMTDAQGNQDVREVRRYSRIEPDGSAKFLLLFDTPTDVRGTALLGRYSESEKFKSSIYLPALGQLIDLKTENSHASLILGTDFSIDNLISERLGDYVYRRLSNRRVGESDYYVVDATPAIKQSSDTSRRQHLIRPDNMFIVQTDFFDRRGRLYKRISHHDLRRLNGTIWYSNMVLMENFRADHKTLLKTQRRVFSNDYVPPEIFTMEWLLKNSQVKAVKIDVQSDDDENSVAIQP